ncbi:MAG: GGDEF domain-containing protein [Dechloromonas sp.]|uniref:diguanylate cyclase n=1 Tax=Candidatus Dechloromonas phosphorivorans TaxID=2899244 RepID=A0A9D7LP94_9RHOO|nr:GGDEF domain-containing protein [Candidatus Dechloromonas phosphorivorans]
MEGDSNRRGLRLATPPVQTDAQRAARAYRENRAPGGPADYYGRIENYAQKIRETTDLDDIIAILNEALAHTRALHAADEVATARAQVAAAEHHIEQLKNELELARRLVHEDPLSGALNRRGLDDALAREAARAERNGTPLCVAMIDIDNFKQVNDSFGHQVGDMVLVHLVAVIKETIRTQDLIGRYGGEEFLLLLPDSGIDEAVVVADRLRKRLAEKPLAWGSQRLFVAFSAGVAARLAGETTDALIRRADQALYQAKQAGKDRAIVAP